MAGSFFAPMVPFGELLQNYRIMRGLTVEQLAQAADVAPSAIRALESNGRVAPPKDVVKKLADALQLGKDDRQTFDLAATLGSPILSAIFKPKQPAALPALPAAIFVFLIADVRGYTRFTQMNGDDAAARLTTKFADIARAVVGRWDGRLLELRGDEALIIFSSVRQGLQAALALQEAFAEETNAHPDLPLEVGIGLDVGEAVPVDDGYRGVALNRAARLCSLAAAGEILVTAGLEYVAAKVEGIAFHERDQAQLKGFDAPVPIRAIARHTTALPEAQ